MMLKITLSSSHTSVFESLRGFPFDLLFLLSLLDLGAGIADLSGDLHDYGVAKEQARALKMSW